MNIHNLPAPLVSALTVLRKAPVPGRLSITSLIGSPLVRVLQMRHAGEIDEDVSENLWALLGSAVHQVIEKSASGTEIKLECQYEGANLVGVIDHYVKGCITDWKLTSKWAAIYADNKSWEQQLQCYAFLAGAHGYPVDKIQVYMILRDWNKREAQKNPDQPQIPFQAIEYPLWDKARISDYLKERVSIHLEAEKCLVGGKELEIPASLWCTPEERWAKPDTYAVMKDGNQRAVRVVESQEAAEKIMEAEIERTKKKHSVVFRPGEDTRCASYCGVSAWCPYLRSKT